MCRPVCRLVDFLWSFSRCYLIHTVWELTEGEAREEIWLFVNSLFFFSTSLIYGKNQHIRQGIVWSKDLKAVLGPEMSRAWGVPGLRLVSRQKGPPAGSSFLQRALSCQKLLTKCQIIFNDYSGKVQKKHHNSNPRYSSEQGRILELIVISSSPSFLLNCTSNCLINQKYNYDRFS